MKLTAVESSNVAAIGYLEDERVLLVRYTDGTLYGYLKVPELRHRQIFAYQSIGKALKEIAAEFACVLITKGVGHAGDPSKAGGAGSVEPGNNEQVLVEGAEGIRDGVPTAPLNVIDEDADKCCRKWFAKCGFEGNVVLWVCPECGQMFKPLVAAGGVIYWRIVPQVRIVRTK